MEIQRSEGIFREEFELDKALIQSLTHSSAAATDFQAGQGGPSKRIMPASMRTTDTPPSAGQPARNSGGFQVQHYRRCPAIVCLVSLLSPSQPQACLGSGA